MRRCCTYDRDSRPDSKKETLRAGTGQPAGLPPSEGVKETLADPGWNFATIPVNRFQAGAPPAKVAESPREDEDLEPGFKRTSTAGAIVGGLLGGAVGAGLGLLLGGGLGGAILGGIAGAALGGYIGNRVTSSSSLSLAASNDSYTDTATESRKEIRFDVGIPTGSNAGDYALVNWVKGYMKDGSGTYFKAKMYGSDVDANYADYQVDSVDADPVYWSDTTGRWNYNPTSSGFYATDNPGPALSSEQGAEYALNFKMRLYRLADIPTTTSGTISSTPLATVPWQYSVKVDSSGVFSHPSI
jgi:uncharacterized protein YcfJ